MATTIFDVTPEELEASARRIDAKASEFTKAYSSIYTAVADLQVNYKGEASDVFNQRIEGYKKNFLEADKALQSYVQFLTEYAKMCKTRETDISEAVPK